MSVTTPDELLRRGVLSPIDHELALTLVDLAGERSPEVALGVALASWAVGRGHVCCELGGLGSGSFEDAAGEEIAGIELPETAAWLAALDRSPLTHDGPLVLEPGGRLYLARYHGYEQTLGRALGARGRGLRTDVDGTRLAEGLRAHFPAPGDNGQRRAALIAALRNLTVITGGPGTGKTYTVARLLRLLRDQRKHRVALLAPTGKAAQRLTEMVQPDFPDLAASTIHRALGYQRRTPTRFRHDRRQPLPAEVVIVDEASMVDLALMAKLVDAVRPDARLILVGDRDQLASVEAGAILGDICAGDPRDGYSAEMVAAAAVLTGDALPRSPSHPAPGPHDSIAYLGTGHRFGKDSAIAALARCVNAGDAGGALEILRNGGEVELVALDSSAELDDVFGPLVLDRLAGLAGGGAEEKLDALGRFRILCAHREGTRGVAGMNQRVAELLARRGVLRTRGGWYEGRPILVTANDYALELFNGDIGVIDRGKACFRTGAELRSFPPGQLPPHETVYAMSVHKAQGSEVDEVALLLPECSSRVLTRELVYTAITRARTKLTIYGSADVLAGAIRARVQRASGLTELLWGERAGHPPLPEVTGR